jgi:hypothetical protein
MSEPNSGESRIEIQTDEDWKTRVKAEDARLDAERSGQSEAPSEEQAAPDLDAAHVPPAGFDMLVQMFSTQAMVALGLLPEPDSGKARRRPNLARHFIDLLGVLEDKTRGNLSAEEEKLLRSTLHYLRMAFVEATGRGTP